MPLAPGRRVQGLLTFSSWFFALCSVVLAISTFWEWRTRTGILRNWPAVTATVRRCSVHRDYPFRRNGGGISVWTVCDVSYDASGCSVDARVSSRPRHAGMSGASYTLGSAGIVTEYPERALDTWVRRHPRGSHLGLRYDPATPSTATFVGADATLDVDPIPGSVDGVVFFLCIGLIAFACARASRRIDVAMPGEQAR
jgi:hypothetical protein